MTLGKAVTRSFFLTFGKLLETNKVKGVGIAVWFKQIKAYLKAYLRPFFLQKKTNFTVRSKIFSFAKCLRI